MFTLIESIIQVWLLSSVLLALVLLAVLHSRESCDRSPGKD